MGVAARQLKRAAAAAAAVYAAAAHHVCEQICWRRGLPKGVLAEGSAGRPDGKARRRLVERSDSRGGGGFFLLVPLLLWAAR